MKRYNNLFDKVVSLDNLYLADKKARRNKSHRKDIIEFDKNKDELLLQLQKQLIEGKYVTSEYHTLIRKNIKHKMCKKVAAMNKLKHMTYSEYRQQVCSHIGWMKHCNGINLLKKIIKYHQLIEYARSS